MKEEYREAILKEGFVEEGYAAFKSRPAVPYQILRITADGELKLRRFSELTSPCDLISVQAPT
ncbi:MAG: hypothetical protein JWL88_615 [Parcubacteria group bacterium]|nr:hypothetical protein [Parcubacteria group bacterium]